MDSPLPPPPVPTAAATTYQGATTNSGNSKPLPRLRSLRQYGNKGKSIAAVIVVGFHAAATFLSVMHFKLPGRG